MSISSRQLAIIYLAIYSCWWGYAIYFLYGKHYDNNYAGGTASLAISIITIMFVLAYLVGFIVTANRSKNYKKFFWLTVPSLLIPIVGICLFEFLHSL